MQYAKIPLSILRDSRLSKNDFRVLGYLIYRSNSEGKCWPSVQDISRQILLDEREVSRHTKRLQNLGLIHKEMSKGGVKNPTIYTITPVDSTMVDSHTLTPVDSYTRTPYINKHITRTKNKGDVSAKRISVFSSDEILSVKIPENLANEKGFISAWENWVKTKVEQKNKKDRFSDAEEVEDLLLEMSEWFADGLDVIDGLKTAKRKKWRDCRKHYFHDLSKVKKPKLSKSEEIDKAFADFRKNNDADNRIRNAGDPQNTDRDLLEFSGGSVHRQSVGVGTRRLLT
tara:strand:+ start:352 stop:1206 length:855 start_codon:yes stop_codon:yes gene_type:complete